MPTFLQRYQDGQRVDVWRDLIQLGDGVRKPEYIDDARAVARETMLRARQNVETILVRLQKLGYEFYTPEMESYDMASCSHDMLNFSNEVMSRMGPPANEAIGNLMSMIGQLGAKMKQPPPKPAPVTDPLNHPDVWTKPPAKIAQHLDDVEKDLGGPLPLSLRAWCEEVGSVSLIGAHPVLSPREGRAGEPVQMYMAGFNDPLIKGITTPYAEAAAVSNVAIVGELPAWDPESFAGYGDPLVVQPVFEWCEEGELILAPSADTKANVSGEGPYVMRVPNAGADGEFVDGDGRGFVDYLRTTFRLGGFPGFERSKRRPERELAYLAEGLLEI